MRAIVGGFNAVESAREIGMDHNPAGSGFVDLATDTGKVFVKPATDRSVHGVVVRIHRGSGEVLPTFPECRCSHVEHVSPAGIRSLRGNPVGDIHVAMLGENFQQILGAEIAGAEMAAVPLNVGDQVLNDSGRALRRWEFEEKGERVAGLVVRAVATGGFVPKFPVEGIGHLPGGVFPAGGILRTAKQGGDAGEEPGMVMEKTGGHEAAGGAGGNRTTAIASGHGKVFWRCPVAPTAVANDEIFRAREQIIGPAREAGVVGV